MAQLICAVRAGLAPDRADLVVGTSAGSVVAAYVRSGWGTSELWDTVISSDLPPAPESFLPPVPESLAPLPESAAPESLVPVPESPASTPESLPPPESAAASLPLPESTPASAPSIAWRADRGQRLTWVGSTTTEDQVTVRHTGQ